MKGWCGLFMAKIKQNHLCKCGSGKKYKNCCGQNQVVSLEHRIETELNEIQFNILRFATKNYHDDINEYLEEYFKEFDIPDEAMELFHFFATTWFITSVELEGKTIMEEYIDRFLHTYHRKRIKDILTTWKKVRPSIYTIIEQDEYETIIVQNLFTNEVTKVKVFDEEHRVDPGGMILGTILPVGGASIFFTTFLDLTSKQSKGRVEQILHLFENSKMASPSIFMTEYFLDVLDVFLFGKVEVTIDDLQWASPKQKEIAQCFQEYIEDGGYDQILANLGIFLWNKYCMRKNPYIKKTTIYVAALLYLVYKLIPFEDFLTQLELAEEFGVSSSSISMKYKDLEEVLAEDIKDLLHEIYDCDVEDIFE